MKLKLIVTICVAFISLSQLNAQDSLDIKVKELLELMGTKKIFDTAIEEMLDMQDYSDDPMSEIVADEFRKKIREKGYSKIYNKLIPIYSSHLTSEEIDGLLEFYKSDVGKSFVQKQPAIMKESMKAGGEWGMEMGREIINELNLTPSNNEERFNLILEEDCSKLKNGNFYYHLNDDIIVEVTRDGNKQVEIINGEETIYEIEWLSNNKYTMTPIQKNTEESSFKLIVNIYEVTPEVYKYIATMEGYEEYLEGQVFIRN